LNSGLLCSACAVATSYEDCRAQAAMPET
jgi:hypothetical protein